MNQPLSHDALKQLFIDARSHHHWQDKSISEDTLRQLYDLTKWGPTSMNISPLRILFLTSKEAKEKLVPTLMGSNVDQVRSSPVTAILAQDMEFFHHLPKLFPHFDAKSFFVGNQELTDISAIRNSSLQGGYFMIAARALGLDVGPMSGFDNAKVDEVFFKGTSLKSNFLCNIGYGDATKLFPRDVRLSFDEACKIL